MMATPKEFCIVCLAHLPQSSARRRLNSGLIKHVVPVLREASARSPSVISGISDRLVCHCSIQTVEKLLRQRKEVEALEDEFADLMKWTAEERGVGESSSGPNCLAQLSSVPSTPHRIVSQLNSCYGHCFAHFFHSNSPC